MGLEVGAGGRLWGRGGGKKIFLIMKGKCARQSFHGMLPSLPIRVAEPNSGVILWRCLSCVTQPLFILWAEFISSVVLPSLFVFLLWLSVSGLLYASPGLPPTNSPIKLPGVSHNGQAPPALQFLAWRLCPLLLLRCPWLAAPQWLMVYSTAKLNFSFPSLFPFLPSLLKAGLVNRGCFGSSGEQSSLAATL